MTRFFLILIAALLYLPAKAELTAEQIMQKAATSVGGSKTVGFRITGSKSMSGSVTTSGKNFYIDAGKTKVWYNGSVMTTLNLNTNEATITNPSASEVNETFPLSYISTWNRDYSVALAKQHPNNAYCIILTAKNKSAAAKKAVLTVSSSNFQPQKMVISLKNGSTATVQVTKITSGGASAASGFQYPQKKYPKVTIVDLR